MDPKNKFAAETVRQLQQSLDEVVPYQETELSKQQTLRALLPQICALRSKGYGWAAVAAMLSERGVPISVAALRTSLRRVREQAANEARRAPTKRLREGRADAGPPERSPRTAPSSAQRGDTPPTQTPRQTGPATSSEVAAQHATLPETRREPEPRRSTFAVRPDTKDI